MEDSLRGKRKVTGDTDEPTAKTGTNDPRSTRANRVLSGCRSTKAREDFLTLSASQSPVLGDCVFLNKSLPVVTLSKNLDAMKNRIKKLPSNYPRFLAEVKQRIRASQYAALRSVNTELINLYWELGRMIFERQERDGWVLLS